MDMEWLRTLTYCIVFVLISEGNLVSSLCDNMTAARIGQFYCAQPEIDTQTQAELDCTEDRLVTVPCYAVPNVTICNHTFSSENEEDNLIFTKELPCRYVNNRRYSYSTALGLSLFLGMFGIDRFYLGYPAIGLVKLCTFGFFFAGQLVDFLLILTQYVTPADRSDYYIPFFGPVLHQLNDNNETFFDS